MWLHGEAILPDRTVPGAFLRFEGGLIAEIRTDPPPGPVTEARWIAPGYVDIHVHGGGGADYMDGTVEAVETANLTHSRHGTTTIFPTTTTGTPDEIEAMLAACAAARAGARIGGVHYYGPYFAEDKVGCHSLEGRRDPDHAEYERAFATGLIKVATCAAELPGCEEFYRFARASGALVTCGHSNSTWNEMVRAFDAGVRHVDHFWCAMSSVASLRAKYGTPMQGGMEQFVLAEPEMSTEVIADGCHLASELLNFAYRMKGSKRLLLVTDANRAVDMPPGRYRFGNRETGPWIESDGKVGFVPGDGLASAVVGMDSMVRNMLVATGAPVHEVIRMATLTPAERVGIERECGSLETGKRADLLLLDESFHIRRVFIGGEEV